MTKKLLFITLIALLNINHLLAADYPVINSVPGGIAAVDLGASFSSSAKVFFGKKRVLVKTDKNKTAWQALIGLPLKSNRENTKSALLIIPVLKHTKHFWFLKKIMKRVI